MEMPRKTELVYSHVKVVVMGREIKEFGVIMCSVFI